MTGEIHGIIDREEAWRMWRPYGERVQLDGQLDPTCMTPEEAVHIVLGADPLTQEEAYDFWYKEEDSRYWCEGLRDLMSGQPQAALVELLASSHNKQQGIALAERTKAIDAGNKFVTLLGMTVAKLEIEGYFTSSQVEAIQSRLLAQDGTPYMQYTPMSRLEALRLAIHTDKAEPTNYGTDGTDFKFGIFRSAMSTHPDMVSVRIHSKVHEAVHGFSGIEVYETTRDDGLHYPQATKVGVFTSDPSTELVTGDDYSSIANAEIAEGWTDFIARELMRIEPKLGTPVDDIQGYGEWATSASHIRTHYPKVFRAITEATLTDAEPSHPYAKTEKIKEMHEIADIEFGTKDSLTKIFTLNSISLTANFAKISRS